jgi:RNA-binding protein YhbY
MRMLQLVPLPEWLTLHPVLVNMQLQDTFLSEVLQTLIGEVDAELIEEVGQLVIMTRLLQSWQQLEGPQCQVG